MPDQIHEPIPPVGGPSGDLIAWKARYEGVLVVAYLDGKAVAGISGPWPVNQYALTWWDRPVPARQLELFGSLEAAQRRVEEWAWRLRTIGLIDRMPANDPIQHDVEIDKPADERGSWLGRLGDLFGAKKPVRVQKAPKLERIHLDHLRNPPLGEEDLRGIHFAAYE